MANVHGFGRGGSGGGGDDPEDPGAGAGTNASAGGRSPMQAMTGGHVLLCGEMVNVASLKWYQYPLCCCCPCCVGPVCSRNRKTNYTNMAKTLAGAIFFACMAMFVVEIIVAGGFVPAAQNKMIGPDSYTLARLGSGYGWRLQQHYEMWRLLSPAFLHGGVFHLLGNMLFLLLIGVPCEQKWGWPRFALLYFVAAVGASLFSVTVHPNAISVGASGALFGIMGGQLADLLMHWSRVDPSTRRMQLLQQVILIIVWMIFSFGATFVDGWAHLGGLLCGLIVGVALWAPESESSTILTRFGRPAAWGVMALYTLLLLGLFFGGVVVTQQLFDGY